MMCKFKLTQYCCCCFWRDKSDDVSEDEKKDNEGIFKVEDEINKNGGSAVDKGNPRNKVALQPGHSLMDWIRLGSSGKDLTGLGQKAGTLAVTRSELARHNKKHDAWIAIRGRVYNITEYFSFHPGGEEELMRGAGIDATKLFEEVHPWVNYEQILQKCLVGKLVTIDAEMLIFGEPKSPSSKSTVSANRLEISSVTSLDSGKGPAEVEAQPDEPIALPRFDWIQKLDYITVIFYTKAFSNPLVEINPPTKEQRTLFVSLTYQGTIFNNELLFFDKVRWPCDINVTLETGKVELIFRKSTSGIWNNYGELRQYTEPEKNVLSGQYKSTYVLKEKLEVNYNTFLLRFERQDGKKIVIPVGKHVRIFEKFNDQEISRSYTPVPECLFDTYTPHNPTGNFLCLLIKQYPHGKLSAYITDRKPGDVIQLSKPLGRFNLKTIEKRDIFLLLAAGTGITPMLELILFLLERRVKKCQFLRLLFFNKTEADLLLDSKFEELENLDKRFRIDNILSEASSLWEGQRGHVNAKLIETSIEQHLTDTGYTIKDMFCFICGPPGFNSAAVQELAKVQISGDQVHVFDA